MAVRYPFDDALRARVADNLAAFARRAIEDPDHRLRHAAVALALLPGPGGEACFLLTLRRASLRSHAGQYALPGGRLDPGETAVQAALRELEEEVGLRLEPSAVLGCLDDFATRSGHLVTPVVVWGPERPRLRLSFDEVEDVYRVPLADLDRPGNPRISSGLPGQPPILALSVLDTLVFAPAGAFLYQFREVGLHGREARVADLEQPRFAWR